MKKRLFLLLFLICIPIVFSYPTLKPYVNDFANVLSDGEEEQLNLMCQAIEKESTVEIAIVTVKSTEGEERIIYANKLGEQSGVGKKATDNGVVILWSITNEKGGAIATGRGIEATLTDGRVNSIGRASRQYFDVGSYYEGFNYIVKEIEKLILPKPPQEQSHPTTDTSYVLTDDELTKQILTIFEYIPWIVFMPLIIIVLVAIVRAMFSGSDYTPRRTYRRRKYRSYYKGDKDEEEEEEDNSSSSWAPVIFSGGGGSSGGGFGGGFGGGSFGGGSFGGGGSSF